MITDFPQQKNAKSTNLMLLDAMHASQVGPGKFMKLNNLPSDEKGKLAFLRCVKNFVNTENLPDYQNPIGNSKHKQVEYKTLDDMDRLLERVTQNDENKTKVSKVSVSLSTLFLHVDQGCFADGTYTPMASPTVNIRSVDIDHVDTLLQKILQEGQKDILTLEDYSVVGYMTYPTEELNSTENTGGEVLADRTLIRYRCGLNQDDESDKEIIGKNANIFNTPDLCSKCFLKVSYFGNIPPLKHHCITFSNNTLENWL